MRRTSRHVECQDSMKQHTKRYDVFGGADNDCHRKQETKTDATEKATGYIIPEDASLLVGPDVAENLYMISQTGE